MGRPENLRALETLLAGAGPPGPNAVGRDGRPSAHAIMSDRTEPHEAAARILESIVFAGLKPGGPEGASGTATQMAWGRCADRSSACSPAAAPTDPLYLTNRTFGQKMRSWLADRRSRA